MLIGGRGVRERGLHVQQLAVCLITTAPAALFTAARMLNCTSNVLQTRS